MFDASTAKNTPNFPFDIPADGTNSLDSDKYNHLSGGSQRSISVNLVFFLISVYGSFSVNWETDSLHFKIFFN